MGIMLWQSVVALKMLPYTEHLSDVRPCLDSAGKAICFAGRTVLICKVMRGGRAKSMRVYIERRKNLDKLYGKDYYPMELPIVEAGHIIAYADVVLTDWYEGMTLQRIIEERYTDTEFMQGLLHRFERFALWLLGQEWAHGDIKPDNIIVDGDNIHLIDHDAMFLPDMCAEDCEEVGTPAYQHPIRSKENFCRDIDDYPLALIITQLAALSYDDMLGKMISDSDNPFIVPAKAICGADEMLDRIEQLFASKGDARHYHIAKLLRSTHLALPTLPMLIEAATQTWNGVSPVEIAYKEGYWGYISDGEWVVPPLYDMAFDAENGRGEVKLSNYWFVIDIKTGEISRLERY